ncbi:hypothetical protein EOI86_16115 [Hwanghaeella grinnelliae]|uniref:Uncharacterized protein n=1 Tax=Hwanghaeella grinnelliae TaxID=2500179 RepID=A0A437QQA1_9PROT|nr:hypothetical protein [Hwanghaeella grinnelliae]RVU36698.1 hypothetical protein EOI86_16115 [Hwanghaeella grinnelliae]
MVRIPSIDYKAFLIQRKFPGYQRELPSRVNVKPYIPSGTTITNSVDRKPKASPANDKVNAKKAWAKLLADVQSYREELDELSEDQLRALYEEERKKKIAEEEQERFYNQPSADADFDYWTKMPHWTLDEAVALSFGKSPKVVNKNSLSKFHGSTASFVKEYEKTLELAQRAIPWKKLFDPVMPSLFIKWAKDTDVPLPEELVERVEARSGKQLDWQEMYQALLEKNNNNVKTANEIIAEKDRILAELQSQGGEKPLRTREKESLLKLVIGMALAGYAYDPSAKRSGVPQEIADDLARKGIQLDVDTVRKWLKEAKDLAPGSLDDEPS